MYGLLLSAILAAPDPAASVPADCDAAAAVARWSDDWSAEESARLGRDAAFELHVRDTGESFRVELPRDGRARVTEARDADYATRFEADRALYCAIADGRMSALTAMGKARAGDDTPLQAEIGADWRGASTLHAILLPAWFHFFTTGRPEIVRFGFDHARIVHGAAAVPLYYAEGLRTAWYGLRPGMHINRDPEDQTNPFDSIVIVIDGALEATLDGDDRTLRKGDTVFVPAGMRHEFRALDAPAGFVLVMTGEGA